VTRRILHFVNTFIPTYGGKTNRIHNLCRDDGYAHVMHVPFPSNAGKEGPGSLKAMEKIENFTITRHVLKAVPSIPLPVLDYMARIACTEVQCSQISKWVAGEQAGLVYGHTPLEFGLAAMRFSRRHGLPFVYEAHGLIHDNLWYPQPRLKYHYHSLMQKYFVTSERRILQNADIVVAQTDSMRERIEELYGVRRSKIRVIYNGVNEEVFDPGKVLEASRSYRKRKGWGNKLVLMYSGFLDRVNGLDFLLEAAKRLPESLKDRIKIVICGRGEYHQMVQDASFKYPHIEFLGLVDYEQMPVLYACADIFVIPRPSTLPSETLVPVKLLEAMAMERVVLVSDVGGMTEIVQDEKNGFVFRNRDLDDFIEKLLSLRERVSNIRRIGEQARKDVVDKYTWAKSRKGLREIYEEVTS